MEMKFNSQICTTREQSERLIALGLKKETADMGIYYSELYGVDRVFSNDVFDEKPTFDCDEIPAWSLHRLIEMALRDRYICGISFVYEEDAYEKVIRIIELQIKSETFPKQYLNTMEKTFNCDCIPCNEEERKYAELESIRGLNESLDRQTREWFEESERIFKKYGL